MSKHPYDPAYVDPIFDAATDPGAALRASQWIGDDGTFSAVKTAAGQYCLYIHDEVTPGGILLSCTNGSGGVAPDLTSWGIPYCDNLGGGNFQNYIRVYTRDNATNTVTSVNYLADGTMYNPTAGTQGHCDECCRRTKQPLTINPTAAQQEHLQNDPAHALTFPRTAVDGVVKCAHFVKALTLGGTLFGTINSGELRFGFSNGRMRFEFDSPVNVTLSIRSINRTFETLTFDTHRPDLIVPSPTSNIPSQAALDALTMPIVYDNGTLDQTNFTDFTWLDVTAVEFAYTNLSGVPAQAAMLVKEIVYLDAISDSAVAACGATQLGPIHDRIRHGETIPIHADGVDSICWFDPQDNPIEAGVSGYGNTQGVMTLNKGVQHGQSIKVIAEPGRRSRNIIRPVGGALLRLHDDYSREVLASPVRIGAGSSRELIWSDGLGAHAPEGWYSSGTHDSTPAGQQLVFEATMPEGYVMTPGLNVMPLTVLFDPMGMWDAALRRINMQANAEYTIEHTMLGCQGAAVGRITHVQTRGGIFPAARAVLNTSLGNAFHFSTTGAHGYQPVQTTVGVNGDVSMTLWVSAGAPFTLTNAMTFIRKRTWTLRAYENYR